MKKRNILLSIIAGLGLSRPVMINDESVEPAKTSRMAPKQMKIHSEKLNKAEYNRSRKARKRIRDQQKSLDNNPCIDTWA